MPRNLPVTVPVEMIDFSSFVKRVERDLDRDKIKYHIDYDDTCPGGKIVFDSIPFDVLERLTRNHQRQRVPEPKFQPVKEKTEVYHKKTEGYTK